MREQVERQISILEAGPSYVPTPDTMAGHRARTLDLRTMLAEIDEQLAELDGEQA